jgi:hypothetical protein
LHILVPKPYFPAGRSSRKQAPSPFTLTTDSSLPSPAPICARCRAQPRPAVATAPQTLELVEDARLFLTAQPRPLIRDGDAGKAFIARQVDDDGRSFRAVADGIADQIQEDLQHPAEFCHGGQRHLMRGSADRDVLFARAHGQDARRAPRCIGQIDGIGQRHEILGLDHLQIGQVIDQPHQMLSRRSDIGGIAGVILGQRPGQARADRLGIGDDAGNGLAQDRGQIAADDGALDRRHRGGRRATDGRWLLGGQAQVEARRLHTRQADRDQRRAPVTLRPGQRHIRPVQQAPVQRLTMLIAGNGHEIGPWAAQTCAHPRRRLAQIAAVALHRHHALPLIQTRGQFGQGTVDLAPAAGDDILGLHLKRRALPVAQDDRTAAFVRQGIASTQARITSCPSCAVMARASFSPKRRALRTTSRSSGTAIGPGKTPPHRICNPAKGSSAAVRWSCASLRARARRGR